MAFSIDDLVDQAKAPTQTTFTQTTSIQTPEQKQANTLAGAYQSPSWLPGAGFLHKLSNAYDDSFTGGLADVATAKAGEAMRNLGVQNTTPDLATLRAQTEQSRQDIGPAANLGASVAGYATGAGKVLGPLARGAAGTGILGAGLEGAAAGGGSAAGHGGSLMDIAEGGLTGGALSGGASSISTTLGPYMRKLYEGLGGGSPAKVTQAATDAADAQWKTFDNFKYNPTDLSSTLKAVRNSVYPSGTAQSYLDATPQTGKILDDYASTLAKSSTRGVQETGTGYTDVMKKLGDVISSGGADAVAAKAAKDAMTNRLAFVNPTNGSSTDVVRNLTEANRLHGLQKNAETLEDMQNSLTYGASGKPAATAQDMLKNQADYYNPDQTAALQRIAKSGQSNPITDVAPFAIPAGGYFAGGGLGAAVGAGVGGATRMLSPVAKAAAVRQQITNSYPALTGQTLVNPEQKVGDLLRQLTGGYLSEDKRTRASLPSDLGVGGYVQPYLGY